MFHHKRAFPIFYIKKANKFVGNNFIGLSKKDLTKKNISNIHQKSYKFISFVHFLEI